MPLPRRRGKNNTFLTEHLSVAASGYCVYFLVEYKSVEVRLKKKKTNFT